MMDIRTAIQKLAKSEIYESILGKVIDVDSATQTCSVQPVDDLPKLLKVRLNANESPTNGIIITPKVDSFVIVGQTSLDQPHVLMFSEVETIEAKINDAECALSENGLKLSVGSNDFKQGVSDLLTALEQLTVNTPNGVSSIPINKAAITAAKNKILGTLQ